MATSTFERKIEISNPDALKKLVDNGIGTAQKAFIRASVWNFRKREE